MPRTFWDSWLNASGIIFFGGFFISVACKALGAVTVASGAGIAAASAIVLPLISSAYFMVLLPKGNVDHKKHRVSSVFGILAALVPASLGAAAGVYIQTPQTLTLSQLAPSFNAQVTNPSQNTQRVVPLLATGYSYTRKP